MLIYFTRWCGCWTLSLHLRTWFIGHTRFHVALDTVPGSRDSIFVYTFSLPLSITFMDTIHRSSFRGAILHTSLLVHYSSWDAILPFSQDLFWTLPWTFGHAIHTSHFSLDTFRLDSCTGRSRFHSSGLPGWFAFSGCSPGPGCSFSRCTISADKHGLSCSLLADTVLFCSSWVGRFLFAVHTVLFAFSRRCACCSPVYTQSCHTSGLFCIRVNQFYLCLRSFTLDYRSSHATRAHCRCIAFYGFLRTLSCLVAVPRLPGSRTLRVASCCAPDTFSCRLLRLDTTVSLRLHIRCVRHLHASRVLSLDGLATHLTDACVCGYVCRAHAPPVPHTVLFSLRLHTGCTFYVLTDLNIHGFCTGFLPADRRRDTDVLCVWDRTCRAPGR